MVVSMTGFASKTIMIMDKQGSQTQLAMSLKSLNSRYFETVCKMPYALNHLETELIKLFKKKLHRGYVVFSVQISNPNIFKAPVQADITTVKSYLTAVERIKKECILSGEPTIHDLFMLPNIFIAEEQAISPEEKKNLLDSINSLLEQLVATRLAEGASLQKDIHLRIESMDKTIKEIENASEKMMEAKKEEVQQKLAQMDTYSEEFSETQRAALYLELDKMDIHEEIVRFKNHLKSLKNTLESSEQEKGRRLDFILQELAREINTITAKCNDSFISSHAINIKVEVEKSREQVQNIV